jgi:hypothetical protein
MKYFKDGNNEVYGYSADGSQDAFIKTGLTAITNEEAQALMNPVVPLTEADYTLATQRLLDAGANAQGYDSMLALVSYAASTCASFKAEADAGIAWRDSVWTAANGLIAQLKAGTMAEVPLAAFLALLPAATWPATS